MTGDVDILGKIDKLLNCRDIIARPVYFNSTVMLFGIWTADQITSAA